MYKMAPRESRDVEIQKQPQPLAPRLLLAEPESVPPRRTHNYKLEEQRLQSFDGFPSRIVDLRQLAAAGFWYTKREDVVCCAFCNVEIGRWEEGDNPMSEHQKWSKNCGFLKNMDVGNIPVDPLSPPPLPALEFSGHDECKIYNIKKSDNCPVIPSLEKLGIQKRYTPAHPMYANLEARLESFNCWPIGLKQKPQELAEAGFFYTGLGDKTVCFQCGGGLKDWSETDQPWREHALYFSKCSFVVQTKGRNFIAEVLGQKPATLTLEEIQALAKPEKFSDVQQGTESTASVSSSAFPEAIVVKESLNEQENSEAPCSSSSKGLDDSRACKICFSREISVVFLPCGHLVSCVNCLSSLTTCALCRKPITATVRVFLP